MLSCLVIRKLSTQLILTLEYFLNVADVQSSSNLSSISKHCASRNNVCGMFMRHQNFIPKLEFLFGQNLALIIMLA